MIYTFLGDSKKARNSVNKNVENLLSKKSDAEVFRVTDENYSQEFFLELLNSQGLFSKKYIVVLDNLISKNLINVEDTDLFKDMKSSFHVFFIIDDILTKDFLDILEKFSEKTTVFEKHEIKKDVFNIFNLANLLGKRDKKNLWSSYLKALNEGVAVEEILGTLFWQAKNIILVKKTKNIKDSGLSSFVYKNAQSFAKKWQDDEILNFANSLVEVSDSVRSGEGEGEVLLERVLLGV